MQVDYGDWKTCCQVLQHMLSEPKQEVQGHLGQLIHNCYVRLRKERKRLWHNHELACGRPPRTINPQSWELTIHILQLLSRESTWSDAERQVLAERKADLAGLLSRVLRPPRLPPPTRAAAPLEDQDELAVCAAVLRRVAKDPDAAADQDRLLHLCRRLHKRHSGKRQQTWDTLYDYQYYEIRENLRILARNPYAAPDPLVMKTAIKQACAALGLANRSRTGFHIANSAAPPVDPAPSAAPTHTAPEPTAPANIPPVQALAPPQKQSLLTRIMRWFQ